MIEGRTDKPLLKLFALFELLVGLLFVIGHNGVLTLNSLSTEFTCLQIRQITFCPPRSDEVRVDPFFLKPPFLVNNTAFFSRVAFPSHFHIKLLSCPPKSLTFAKSTSFDDSTYCDSRSIREVPLVAMQPVGFYKFSLLTWLTLVVWA